MQNHKAKRFGDKTEQINIRVTPAEKEQLTTAAAALGLSMSAFVLAMALGDKIGQIMIEGFEKNK